VNAPEVLPGRLMITIRVRERHSNRSTGPRETSRSPSAYRSGIVPQGTETAGLTWENGAASIPRMFRDQRHTAAFKGSRLHVRTSLINRETAAQAANPCSCVVGRVGLEPTTHGL
jgi:hypothetical protein